MIECGKKVQEGWNAISKKHKLNIHVSGIYPLSHFEFKENPLVLKTLFTQEMLGRGFLATTSFYSSFAHKDEHIHKYLTAVEEVFKLISNSLKDGNSEKLLKGPICQSGFKRLA